MYKHSLKLSPLQRQLFFWNLLFQKYNDKTLTETLFSLINCNNIFIYLNKSSALMFKTLFIQVTVNVWPL